MTNNWKSLLKGFVSFVALFWVGYVVLFSFQNCGRAQFGLQDVAGKATGQNVIPQDVAPTCPTGQVAIGVKSDLTALCASFQPRNSTMCNNDEYIYTIGGGASECVAVSSRDPGATLCGYNQMLVSFTDAVSITCSQMPAAPTGCPAGQWLIGYQSNNAVCSGPTTPNPSNTPVASPTPGGAINVSCPAGHYLEGIVNSMPVCKKILPDVAPTAACPAGQALVGQTGTTASCQNLMNVPTDNQSCANGYLKSLGASPGCEALPAKDYAHYCGDGKYLKTITTQGFLCENLPSNMVRYNGTCLPGYYLYGFENQMPKCAPVTTTPIYNHFCPRGFYAAEIVNNVVICKPHQTGGLLCVPGSQRMCNFPNGAGAQTCTPDGKAWGACVPTTCNTGYDLTNMTCVPTTCPVGYDRLNGQCVDKTAPKVEFTKVPELVTNSLTALFMFNVSDTGSGLHTVQCRLDSGAFADCTNKAEYQLTALGTHVFEIKAVDKAGNSTKVIYKWTAINQPPVCQPGKSSLCLVGNSIGSQACKPDGSGYGTCVAHVCPTGFEMKSGCCVPVNCSQCQPTCKPGDKALCFVTNGLGEASCKSDGKGYGACSTIACQSGYKLTDGKCIK